LIRRRLRGLSHGSPEDRVDGRCYDGAAVGHGRNLGACLYSRPGCEKGEQATSHDAQRPDKESVDAIAELHFIGRRSFPSRAHAPSNITTG
jgi:hypothetical protein